jgi:hypothetical protein
MEEGANAVEPDLDPFDVASFYGEVLDELAIKRAQEESLAYHHEEMTRVLREMSVSGKAEENRTKDNERRAYESILKATEELKKATTSEGTKEYLDKWQEQIQEDYAKALSLCKEDKVDA